ncbi:MAG: ABC transporter ATP-binding protein [Opitutales bacterium]
MPADADKPPLLVVERVMRHYGEQPVLRGVDFTVHSGERVALMGPSGSGKTTLLNCLGGIDRPDSGHIRLEGTDLAALAPPDLAKIRRTRLGQVFQFFHLLPTLSAAENVELPLQLNGVPPDERADRVAELLEASGIAQRGHARPAELSGGEMQRVAIARALAARPALILADEPTGNLDSKTGQVILDLLERLSDEFRTAVLLVTHSRAATRICGRTLAMKDGTVQPAGRDAVPSA